MKKLLNQLIQLQELYFALDEQKVAGHENRFQELEEDIKILREKLPPDISIFFEKLNLRDPPAVAPVVHRTCYGCGIGLPTSLEAELLRMDSLIQCPNCARYLYPYRGGELQPASEMLQHKLPRLGIEKFSSEKLMMPHLESDDREGIIIELGQLLADQLFFDNPQILIEKALQREAIVSTAVEHSLAFPHVRGIDSGSLTFTLGLKKKGIKFGAPQNRLTRIFFFIVIPVAASAFYLKLLAGLIETFSQAEARKKLLACATQEELWETLKKTTKKHIA